MSMANLMGAFLKLQQEIDTETIGLLVRFCQRAMDSGNPRMFLREVLKAVVETPEPEPGQPARVVEVQVLPRRK